MRMKIPCVVITFHTTAEAMKTEQICKAKNLAGKLISAPRSLSADCGIAWRSPADTREELTSLLEQSGVEVSGVYEMVM